MRWNEFPAEKRAEVRARRSDVIEWSVSLSDPGRPALLLEASKNGLAFAWRGDFAPKANSLILLTFRQASAPVKQVEARIRRVTRVHEDLYVIGAEMWRVRPFPPASQARARLPKRVVDATGQGSIVLTPNIAEFVRHGRLDEGVALPPDESRLAA